MPSALRSHRTSRAEAKTMGGASELEAGPLPKLRLGEVAEGGGPAVFALLDRGLVSVTTRVEMRVSADVFGESHYGCCKGSLVRSTAEGAVA